MNFLYCILFNQHDQQIREIVCLVLLDLQREKQYIPLIQLLVHYLDTLCSVPFSRLAAS